MSVYRTIGPLVLIESALFLSKVKVETSGERTTKLPENRVGTDSGTFVIFVAVNPKLNQLKV